MTYPRKMRRTDCGCRGEQAAPGAEVKVTEPCTKHKPLAAGERVRVVKANIRPLKRFGGRGLERTPRVTATGEEGDGKLLSLAGEKAVVQLDAGRCVVVAVARVKRAS